jgi:transposase
MIKSPKLKQKQKVELKNIINDGNSSSKEVRRAQAIILVDNDRSIEEITDITGYERSQVFELRKKYLADGLTSIQDQRRQRPQELLTRPQRDEVVGTVKTTKPSDHGYKSEYWTTNILGDYIRQKYNIKYKSKTSYYLLFKQANFTFHKPGRVYEKRDETEVARWRKATKTKVKRVLREEPETVILTEDEMSLSMQTTFQKIWLPAGEYPKIEVASSKEARSIYGFLNIKTGKEHAFKTEWQNMHITAKVLGKLRKVYPTHKILLIWDQAPSHKGSKAQEFIKNDGKIEQIYFPRAAPEENPQEHVWKKGRSNISHNKYIQNINTTTDEFVSYLNKTEFKYSFLGLESARGM